MAFLLLESCMINYCADEIQNWRHGKMRYHTNELYIAMRYELLRSNILFTEIHPHNEVISNYISVPGPQYSAFHTQELWGIMMDIQQDINANSTLCLHCGRQVEVPATWLSYAGLPRFKPCLGNTHFVPRSTPFIAWTMKPFEERAVSCSKYTALMLPGVAS
jgi:hypothetical protein